MLKIEFKAMVLSNKSSLILKHYAVTKTKNPWCTPERSQVSQMSLSGNQMEFQIFPFSMCPWWLPGGKWWSGVWKVNESSTQRGEGGRGRALSEWQKRTLSSWKVARGKPAISAENRQGFMDQSKAICFSKHANSEVPWYIRSTHPMSRGEPSGGCVPSRLPCS